MLDHLPPLTFHFLDQTLTFSKLFLTLLNNEYPGIILVSTGGDLTIQPSHNTSEMAGKASIFANYLQNYFHEKIVKISMLFWWTCGLLRGRLEHKGLWLGGVGRHRATVCLSLRRLAAKVKLRRDNIKCKSRNLFYQQFGVFWEIIWTHFCSCFVYLPKEKMLLSENVVKWIEIVEWDRKISPKWFSW